MRIRCNTYIELWDRWGAEMYWVDPTDQSLNLDDKSIWGGITGETENNKINVGESFEYIEGENKDSGSGMGVLEHFKSDSGRGMFEFNEEEISKYFDVIEDSKESAMDWDKDIIKKTSAEKRELGKSYPIGENIMFELPDVVPVSSILMKYVYPKYPEQVKDVVIQEWKVSNDLDGDVNDFLNKVAESSFWWEMYIDHIPQWKKLMPEDMENEYMYISDTKPLKMKEVAI